MIGGAGVRNAGEPPFEIRVFFLENFVIALGLLITTLSFGQYLGQDTCSIISYVSSPGKMRSEATYSVLEPNGTAPLVEFADVFNPDGNPQGAMVHMMMYPNFVSEKWSHVLTWDLLIGRWIWLDRLRRNIFTSHSVLLANLIGPPGLLLHFATCAITGKEILLGNEMNEITKD
jgi:hypothetical protein